MLEVIVCAAGTLLRRVGTLCVIPPRADTDTDCMVERTKVGCGCWMCLNDAALGEVVLCSYAMTIIAAKIKRKRSGEDCRPAVTWVVDVFVRVRTTSYRRYTGFYEVVERTVAFSG